MNPNAAGFDPSRQYGGGQQYSGAEFYPTNTGGAESYDPNLGYYEAVQQGGYHQAAQYQGEAAYPPDPSMDPYAQWNQQQEVVSPGYYYPTMPLAPQLYGAPISALAYDDRYAALYVASHTQPSTERRHGSRASMLVTHSTLDGTLYSSCAGHPEASRESLRDVYQTFFGGQGKATTTKIPPHAYRPPYGQVSTSTGFNAHPSQMGITTLLPFKGYVASVSPSAVRVHSHGGLCLNYHDIEGMVCGTPHPSPDGAMTHVSVGGMAIGSQKSHVHCMDLYQGLRIVSSNTFRSELDARPMGVMGMATNYHKQTIVAGCSDGTIRLLDGSWRKRGGSELAKVKSHSGGVSNVAVSHDGNLICTTGFSSRPSGSIGSSPYAYLDQHLLVYDVRYLGRGGFVHQFSGIRGGPRFVSFLPDMNDQPTSRILVASGNSQGGLQIIVPFDNTGVDPAGFLVPQLTPGDQLTPGESITAMTVSEERLALGTSRCNVLQYELQGFDKSTTYKREPLVSPDYTPKLPAVSIPPDLLRSPTGDIFSAYVLCKDPAVSKSSAFARLAQNVFVASSKRNVSAKLTNAAIRQDGDFMATIPVAKLDVDLMEDCSPSEKKEETEPLPNPNKLLYARPLSELCYDTDANRKRMTRGKARRNQSDNSSTEESTIPPRYRLTLRPPFVAGSHFDHAEHNSTGLWPGWDYSLFMPNSFAVGVLVMMYFEPQVRVALLARQLDPKLLSNSDKERASALGMELGFIFNQIDSISKYALAHPGDSTRPHIGVLTPVNFMTTFAVMPEAVTLALADGSAECVDRARRPEAFYRFLLYHLDKELSSTGARKRTGDSSKLLDSLHGVDFISANEFITGSSPPTISSQRHLTVDLAYEPFLKAGASDASFGEVLRHALCRETRLRAWNSVAKSYETIVQRKIAASLPKVLSLSCACAGRKEEEGLSLWRGSSDHGHWLPEYVKIDMESDGNVTVHELVEQEGSDEKIWKTIKGKTSISSEVAKLVSKKQNPIKSRKYRLDAVLSFVRDDSDPAFADQLDGWSTDGSKGHHVLHIREPSAYKRRALQKQREEADRLAEAKEADKEANKWTLTANTSGAVLRKRVEAATERLEAMSNDETSEGNNWVLFNGFVVSDTVVEDARAFHVPFKEPSLVVFRAVSDEEAPNSSSWRKTKDETLIERNEIPASVMHTSSISTGEPALTNSQGGLIPKKGDLIAFDAEFVSVQEEESVLTDSGSKVTVRETRYALARISVLSCKTGQVILDDHVLPREPVVDYLTRFSGIVARDLDPKLSPHHLISTRSAYLKLRFLQELGCIFVGHGLSQDFLTANLFVPPSQIIDTVNIYHKPKMRYVSLRFLTNFVLKRDMQQDVHDSVEDARAAWELLQKAQEFQANGTFDQVLNDLYEYGQKADWKVGVGDDDDEEAFQ